MCNDRLDVVTLSTRPYRAAQFLSYCEYEYQYQNKYICSALRNFGRTHVPGVVVMYSYISEMVCESEASDFCALHSIRSSYPCHSLCIFCLSVCVLARVPTRIIPQVHFCASLSFVYISYTRTAVVAASFRIEPGSSRQSIGQIKKLESRAVSFTASKEKLRRSGGELECTSPS